MGGTGDCFEVCVGHDDGPVGEIPPAVLAYESRLDVTRAEIVRLTGERDAAVAEVAHQRKIAARRADVIRDLTAAHDGAVRDLMAIHQIAAEQRARADAAEARLRAVEALHKPRPNSTSAMYPTPLCSCGEDYPECPTAAALSSDAAPQAAGVTREAVEQMLTAFDIFGPERDDYTAFVAALGIPVADAPAAPEGERPGHEFVGVYMHPDDDECTYRADGTDLTYCGLTKAEHEGER